MKDSQCTTVQIPLGIVKSMSYLQILAAGICQWHWVSVLAQQLSFPWALHQLILFSSAEKRKRSPSKDKYLTSYIHQTSTYERRNFYPQSVSHIWMRNTLKKYAQHQTAIFMMMTSLWLPWANHHHHKTKFYFKIQSTYFTGNWKTPKNHFTSPKFKTVVGIKTENKQKY